MAAFALAALVHVLTLVVAATGLFLASRGGFIPIVAGVLLLGVALILRPRPTPEPDDSISPDTLPHLAALAASVAESVGTRPADLIRLDADFNAWVTEVGWRRRRVLSIGVPLFALLQPQERVAVLAHEFGHFVNGDPLRGWFTQTAINSLITWTAVLRPQALFEDDDSGIPWPLMLPVNLVMLALSWIPLSVAIALITLTFRDSQRAEYLADARSAEVAGTDAAVSSLARLHLAGVYSGVIQASNDANWLNHSLWDELHLRAEQLPESERERARRIELSTVNRVDLSHPPTTYRAEVVAKREHESGNVQVDSDTAAQIDAELRSASAHLQRDVIENHLARLSA